MKARPKENDFAFLLIIFSIIPIMNWKLCYFCTLLYESIRVIDKLLQVFCIFRLTRYSSQSLVPNNWLFILVLYALSDQLLVFFTSNLTQNETNFMLEQTCLCLEVFFWQELTQSFPCFFTIFVSHQVHYSIFTEERYFFSQKKPKISFLLKEAIKFAFFQECIELLLGKRSSRFFCAVIELSIFLL